jgi:hypothetical protein
MKAKEIITKLDIQAGLRGQEKQEQFFSIMSDELREIYNRFKQKDSERHFSVSVRELRQKWDGISKKMNRGLSDGLWNFFFATYVVKLKEELCPTWAKKQKESHDKYLERQKRAAEREEAKRNKLYQEQQPE